MRKSLVECLLRGAMASTANTSVTAWIADLKQGQQEAAQKLWQRYCQRLVEMARHKLGHASRRVSDEEDIALMAFHRLCEAVEKGKFSQLNDRDDLWQILLVITERKVIDHVRALKRKKRGSGKVRGESVFLKLDQEEMSRGIERVMDSEPTPEYAVLAIEQCRELLEMLPSKQLRQIALWKLEGWKNREIAEKLGCITETVERKLRGIREIWSEPTREESD